MMDTIAWKEYFSKFNFLKHPIRQPNSEYPESPAPRREARRVVNFFAADLLIDGSVTSDSDMVVEGVIRGDVVCRGHLEVLGQVQGNISAHSVRVIQGRIKGNITAEDGVSVCNSEIKGDIFSQQAEIDSTVNGNITVGGILVIKQSSVIKGNIVAGGLSIEENALLEGQVNVTRTPEAASAAAPAPTELAIE